MAFPQQNIVTKIQDGTRSEGGAFLCKTCASGFVARGGADSQELIMCSAVPGPGLKVPFKVVECTDYNRRGAVALYHMKEISWSIEMKGNKIVGFKKPVDVDDNLPI